MINKDYLYTKKWDDLSIVVLESDALYLYAQDPEAGIVLQFYLRTILILYLKRFQLMIMMKW